MQAIPSRPRNKDMYSNNCWPSAMLDIKEVLIGVPQLDINPGLSDHVGIYGIGIGPADGTSRVSCMFWIVLGLRHFSALCSALGCGLSKTGKHPGLKGWRRIDELLCKPLVACTCPWSRRIIVFHIGSCWKRRLWIHVRYNTKNRRCPCSTKNMRHISQLSIYIYILYYI